MKRLITAADFQSEKRGIFFPQTREEPLRLEDVKKERRRKRRCSNFGKFLTEKIPPLIKVEFSCNGRVLFNPLVNQTVCVCFNIDTSDQRAEVCDCKYVCFFLVFSLSLSLSLSLSSFRNDETKRPTFTKPSEATAGRFVSVEMWKTRWKSCCIMPCGPPPPLSLSLCLCQRFSSI